MTRFALAMLVILMALPLTTAPAQTAAELEAAPSAASPVPAPVPSFIVAVPSKPGETAPALPRRMWPFLKAPGEAVPTTPPTATSMIRPLTISTPSPAAVPSAPATTALLNRRTATKSPKPRAVVAVTVVNGSEIPVTTITIAGEAQIVSHTEPLAPKAQATLKLPKMRGCLVTVAATFEGGSMSSDRAIDVCRVKLVRLTD